MHVALWGNPLNPIPCIALARKGEGIPSGGDAGEWAMSSMTIMPTGDRKSTMKELLEEVKGYRGLVTGGQEVNLVNYGGAPRGAPS